MKLKDSYRRSPEECDGPLTLYLLQQFFTDECKGDIVTFIKWIAQAPGITSYLAECDEAKRDGLEREDVVGRDLSDGSEVRCATLTNTNTTEKPKLGYSLGNVKNKTGLLRARCYDPETRVLTRFKIPKGVYPDTLKIRPDKKGTYGKIYTQYIDTVETIPTLELG